MARLDLDLRYLHFYAGKKTSVCCSNVYIAIKNGTFKGHVIGGKGQMGWGFVCNGSLFKILPIRKMYFRKMNLLCQFNDQN